MDYTPEQQADFQNRAVAFQTEYDELYKTLSEKHQIEIQYAPVYIPTGRGTFDTAMGTNLGDLKYKPLAAPAEAGEVIKA